MSRHAVGEDVLYIQATVEFKTQTGPRVQEADEYQGWSQGSGPAASEGTRAPDRLDGVVLMPRASEDRGFFLRRSADIERVKRDGRRFQTPLFNLLSCASGTGNTRIGIVVGKRLGGAVTRNRAKRMFRELARQVREQLVGGRALVVFPRREALLARHPRLREAWRSALRHEGLLVSEPDGRCDNSASV